MAFTQAQLDALDEMIAAGVTETEYEGKKVVFASLNDLMRRRDFIARKLGQSSAKNARIYPTLSKGFDCANAIGGCNCSGGCSCGFSGGDC
jgi:hypothetical protein